MTQIDQMVTGMVCYWGYHIGSQIFDNFWTWMALKGIRSSSDTLQLFAR